MRPEGLSKFKNSPRRVSTRDLPGGKLKMHGNLYFYLNYWVMHPVARVSINIYIYKNVTASLSASGPKS
jgi:hypothetical protein